MSIHNLAYQGRFSYRLFEQSGLPLDAWNMEGVEFYSSFNFLKAGLAYVDMITTVSPSYAQEIMTPDFGCGLEGILRRQADLVGILNGADYAILSPEHDPVLTNGFQGQSGREAPLQGASPGGAQALAAVEGPAGPWFPLVVFGDRRASTWF